MVIVYVIHDIFMTVRLVYVLYEWELIMHVQLIINVLQMIYMLMQNKLLSTSNKRTMCSQKEHMENFVHMMWNVYY